MYRVGAVWAQRAGHDAACFMLLGAFGVFKSSIGSVEPHPIRFEESAFFVSEVACGTFSTFSSSGGTRARSMQACFSSWRYFLFRRPFAVQNNMLFFSPSNGFNIFFFQYGFCVVATCMVLLSFGNRCGWFARHRSIGLCRCFDSIVDAVGAQRRVNGSHDVRFVLVGWRIDVPVLCFPVPTARYLFLGTDFVVSFCWLHMLPRTKWLSKRGINSAIMVIFRSDRVRHALIPDRRAEASWRGRVSDVCDLSCFFDRHSGQRRDARRQASACRENKASRSVPVRAGRTQQGPLLSCWERPAQSMPSILFIYILCTLLYAIRSTSNALTAPLSTTLKADPATKIARTTEGRRRELAACDCTTDACLPRPQIKRSSVVLR